ncbi:hypothetical protein ACFLY2_03575 [Patescibacteria group bacterium]
MLTFLVVVLILSKTAQDVSKNNNGSIVFLANSSVQTPFSVI